MEKIIMFFFLTCISFWRMNLYLETSVQPVEKTQKLLQQVFDSECKEAERHQKVRNAAEYIS